MKLQITVLKAPWPKGAKVGDIVEMKHVPGWALGKCAEVPESTEATIDFDQAEEVAEHPEVARIRQAADHALQAAASELQAARDAHATEVRNLQADHAAEVADLKAQVAKAESAGGARLQELVDANAALTAELAEVKALHAKGNSGKR